MFNYLKNEGKLLPGTLDVSHNHLTSLPFLQYAPSINSLLVSHNRIFTLPPSAFSPLTCLQTLDLSHNTLQTLPSRCVCVCVPLSDVARHSFPLSLLLSLCLLLSLSILLSLSLSLKYSCFMHTPILAVWVGWAASSTWMPHTTTWRCCPPVSASSNPLCRSRCEDSPFIVVIKQVYCIACLCLQPCLILFVLASPSSLAFIFPAGGPQQPVLLALWHQPPHCTRTLVCQGESDDGTATKPGAC